MPSSLICFVSKLARSRAWLSRPAQGCRMSSKGFRLAAGKRIPISQQMLTPFTCTSKDFVNKFVFCMKRWTPPINKRVRYWLWQYIYIKEKSLYKQMHKIHKKHAIKAKGVTHTSNKNSIYPSFCINSNGTSVVSVLEKFKSKWSTDEMNWLLDISLYMLIL